jgi:hypothetical protein
MKKTNAALSARRQDRETLETLSVTRPASAPIDRDALGRRVVPFRGRRLGVRRLVLLIAERALDAPYSDAASLRIDRAIVAFEDALDDVEEEA